jgi:hypothetical protein
MDDYREILFSRAFKIVPGTEYNQVSQELRDENPETLFSIYEIVLQENQSWDYMKERVYPNLVKYLKYELPRRKQRGIKNFKFCHSALDAESSPVFWIPASAGMTNSSQAAGNTARRD